MLGVDITMIVRLNLLYLIKYKTNKGGNTPFKTNIMKRKIENFIFTFIIYFSAFGWVCLFLQLCAQADKWLGL